MTAENLHDAIGLLPADLVAETDRCRCRKKVPIRWQRYAAMAACAALVFCASYGILLLSSPKSCDRAGGAPEMTMQQMTGVSNQAAPAEAAPMEAPAAAAMDEAIQTVEEEQVLPTYAANENSAASMGHSHDPAQRGPSSIDRSFQYAGEIPWATVFFGDEIITLEGESAALLRDILYCLPYSEENLCPCAPEFTVDTEDGDGYAVSLNRYFVRYNGKQAVLTEEEAAQIEGILKDFVN